MFLLRDRGLWHRIKRQSEIEMTRGVVSDVVTRTGGHLSYFLFFFFFVCLSEVGRREINVFVRERCANVSRFKL